MPTISTHVSEDWEYHGAFKTKVKKDYGDRPGPYLRELIERDLAGFGVPPLEFLALQRAELALLGAERHARDWMFAAENEKPAAMRRLVEYILDATRRRAVGDQAAEEAAPYPDTTATAATVQAAMAAELQRSLKQHDAGNSEPAHSATPIPPKPRP